MKAISRCFYGKIKDSRSAAASNIRCCCRTHNGLSIYNAINNYRESHIALMSRTNTHEVYENNFILSYVYHFFANKIA